MVASLDGLLRRLPGVPALWRINIVVFVQGHGSSRLGAVPEWGRGKDPQICHLFGYLPPHVW